MKRLFRPPWSAAILDYASAVNAEVGDLKAAGADVIQLDEPWVGFLDWILASRALPIPAIMHLAYRVTLT